MDRPSTAKELAEVFAFDRRMVEEALAIESDLTRREVEFVESLGRRVHDACLALTERQRSKLLEILARF